MAQQDKTIRLIKTRTDGSSMRLEQTIEDFNESLFMVCFDSGLRDMMEGKVSSIVVDVIASNPLEKSE